MNRILSIIAIINIVIGSCGLEGIMVADVISSSQNGDPLVFVFNFPAGFWHLAQISQIDKPRWVALSEVLFVLTRPHPQDGRIDYGSIISPRLASVRCVKDWTETFLNTSRCDLLNAIIRIQDLQLADYIKQIALLESQYCDETTRSIASKIYLLQGKIKKNQPCIQLAADCTL
jgi:hypothetical protein